MAKITNEYIERLSKLNWVDLIKKSNELHNTKRPKFKMDDYGNISAFIAGSYCHIGITNHLSTFSYDHERSKYYENKSRFVNEWFDLDENNPDDLSL